MYLPVVYARTCTDRLAREIDREIGKHGYWFDAVGPQTEDELLAIARSLGRPLADRRDPRLAKPVSPSSSDDAPANTLSARYGFGDFPFHSDSAHWTRPADLLLLYCVTPGAAGRATFLQDSHTWVLPPRARRVLRNEPWCVAGVSRPFLCTHVDNAGACVSTTTA